MPLFHRVHTGTIADVSLFADVAKELLERHDELIGPNKDATLVFDKGNVSDQAMQRFVVPGRHFVAEIPANQAPELIAGPLDNFEDVPGLPGTKAHAVKHEFWDKECTAVVAYTESFFTLDAELPVLQAPEHRDTAMLNFRWSLTTCLR